MDEAHWAGADVSLSEAAGRLFAWAAALGDDVGDGGSSKDSSDDFSRDSSCEQDARAAAAKALDLLAWPPPQRPGAPDGRELEPRPLRRRLPGVDEGVLAAALAACERGGSSGGALACLRELAALDSSSSSSSSSSGGGGGGGWRSGDLAVLPESHSAPTTAARAAAASSSAVPWQVLGRGRLREQHVVMAMAAAARDPALRCPAQAASLSGRPQGPPQTAAWPVRSVIQRLQSLAEACGAEKDASGGAEGAARHERLAAAAAKALLAAGDGAGALDVLAPRPSRRRYSRRRPSRRRPASSSSSSAAARASIEGPDAGAGAECSDEAAECGGDEAAASLSRARGEVLWFLMADERRLPVAVDLFGGLVARGAALRAAAPGVEKRASGAAPRGPNPVATALLLQLLRGRGQTDSSMGGSASRHSPRHPAPAPELPPLAATMLTHAFQPPVRRNDDDSDSNDGNVCDYDDDDDEDDRLACFGTWVRGGGPRVLLREALGLLHGEGRFAAADEAYALAAASKVVSHWKQAPAVAGSAPSPRAVDLHGLSGPLACAAIRAALTEHHRIWLSSGGGQTGPNLVIITGQGLHSARSSRGSADSSDHGAGPASVLRAAVQRMLTEEFNPPLDSWTVPGNAGRLVVPAAGIAAWAAASLAAKAGLMARLGELVAARTRRDAAARHQGAAAWSR